MIAVDTIQGLRGSLGGGTKLEITVDSLQNGTVNTIQEIEGVETAVTPDNSTIEATCTNDAKMDILVGLRDAGIDVVNFRTQEASLEDMFIEYTETDQSHNNNTNHDNADHGVTNASGKKKENNHGSQSGEQSEPAEESTAESESGLESGVPSE